MRIANHIALLASICLISFNNAFLIDFFISHPLLQAFQGFLQNVLKNENAIVVEQFPGQRTIQNLNIPENSALLIIDVQNDFISGTLPVPNGEQVVPFINKLLEIKETDFNAIVYTRDWHPEDHISFFGNRELYGGLESMKMFEKVNLTRSNQLFYEQILWPRHCVQNELGSEFHPNLKIINSPTKTIQIKKGYKSQAEAYSGFFDNYHEFDTGLHAQLQAKNIANLFIVGLASDVCVDFTARDGLDLGYKVSVIMDGSRGVYSEKVEKEVIPYWREIGVNVL